MRRPSGPSPLPTSRRRANGCDRTSATPLRSYAPLDAAVGSGVRVLVKHENVNPTGAFKVRNGLSALTTLPPGRPTGRRGRDPRQPRPGPGLGRPPARRAGDHLRPRRQQPREEDAIGGLGASLVEEGRDYDEAVAVAERLVREQGLPLVHSTNDAPVIAGAGTLTLEILEEEPGSTRSSSRWAAARRRWAG